MTAEPAIPAIFCRHCGYNLHGLPANRCSECGRAFDPKDRKTYSKNAGSLSRGRWARRIVISFTTVTLLAASGVLGLWWPWHRDGAAIRMVHRCRGSMDIRPVGPQWAHDLLGRRWGFLLDRAGPVCSLCGNRRVTDADLSALDGLSGVQTLVLWYTNVTDAGLEHLKDLKGLHTLNLRNTKVTDAGLEHLKDLKELRTLNLGRTQVTDRGLEHLKDLEHLQTLNLCGTQVTDAGLEHLDGLKGLQNIDLRDTKVTDAGLEHLKGVKGLQTLCLNGTKVSEGGVTALRKALPACGIIHRSSQ